MKSSLILLFLLLAVVPLCSFGQSTKVQKGAAKSWVKSVSIPKDALPEEGEESSYYYLLVDEQENVSLQESYLHYAYKILTNEGLQEMADLSIEFDPTYEQFIFHAITIHREGNTINQLPGEIKTLQREQSMERNLYDGSLTAIVNLTDVRVGDIVEYSFTRKGYNPIYENHFSRWRNFNYSTPTEKFFLRLTVPSSLSLSIKYLNTTQKPQITNEPGQVSYTWELGKSKGLLRDSNEPDWYNPYETVMLTSFKNWNEVAKWATKRYSVSEQDKQAVLRNIVPTFKSTTQELYALEAIRFVQDNIRYLGFESGLNSHKPHPPTQVFNQRFGDCKDKSLLLATILNAKGIESYPVLVNTVYRNKLAEQPPLLGSFDHCVVQFKLNDKTFFVDPTISSQGGDLNNYHFPNYGKGLVVNGTSSDLTDLPTPQKSSIHEVQTFDLATIGGEGMLRVETTYKGSEADYQRSYFANNSLEKIQKDYVTYYGNLYPDIQKFEALQVDDDRHNNVFKIKEKYKIPTFWKPYNDQPEKIYCEFYPQSLEGYFNVSKSAARLAPYRLAYPLNFSHEIHVTLPEEWTITPNQVDINSDYYQYHFKTIYDNKFLSLLTDYSTKRESVAVADFGKFIEDHGKMMSNLSYSLSYDKSLAKNTANKWPGLFVTVLSLLFGAGLVYWLYTNYDPAPFYPHAWGLPIGGWLILVGLGVSLTPLRLLYDFFTSDFLLSGEGWLSMFYTKRYEYFLFLLLEHIYNLIYLLVSVLAVVLFFQKRTSAPRIISIIYGVSCLVTILDTVLAVQMSPGTTVDYKEIVRSVIAAAIWIPYLHQSQRVKKTFVVTDRNNNSGAVVEPVPIQ